MSVRDVIATMNQMVADGAVERYAIGGAVGATFYLEPVATLDIDVFVTLKGGLIVTPSHIFDYLRAHGHSIKGEYVVIAEWPVQFLPAAGPLLEEALAAARVVDVEGVPARVFTAEHLAAIALQTGRAKDKARLLQFIEQGALDGKRFQEIVQRHGLVDAWTKFERQFLSGTP